MERLAIMCVGWGKAGILVLIRKKTVGCIPPQTLQEVDLPEGMVVE